MAVTALKSKNAVESLRDIVQDLLVPEFKTLKAELDSQRRENKVTSDAIRSEIDGLRVELRLRDEKQSQSINALSDKIGILMEIRERLAVLEDRKERS